MFKLRLLLTISAALTSAGCTHLFFQPSAAIFSDPAAEGLRYETIKFSAADATPLTGIFFPAAGAPLGTIVHFHGNARNMTAHFPYSAWLAKEGFNVFIFDYRGYGASGGKPQLPGLVLDGMAALAQAARLPGAQPGKIIVFGQSLGGAVAAAAVAQYGLTPAAMVLEGVFYSYKGVAAAVLRSRWWSWPLAWLPAAAVTAKYAPSDYIGKIACPKIFIHSLTDRAVPAEQGRKLFNAAGAPKEFWQVPSGHIEAFGQHRAVYGPKLVEFLKTALKS